MLQTSLLLMKSLNKTETPIFLSVMCFLFSKAIFLTFIAKHKNELFCSHKLLSYSLLIKNNISIHNWLRIN